MTSRPGYILGLRLRLWSALGFVGALLLCAAPVRANNVTVDCTGGTPGAFTSVQSAIDSLNYVGPHTVTMLNGNIANCIENVLILNRQRITFQPQTSGFGVTIVSPDPSNVPVRVFGSTGIVFTEVGFGNGFNGLVVDRGSEVQALGCTVSGNSNAGIIVRGNSTLRIGSGLIQNNGGTGVNVVGGGSLTVDSDVTIQNNGSGVRVVNGSNVRIFAPAAILSNSVGITAGDASSVTLFGDPDTPSPVRIEGNTLIGINTFGGHVVMFGPVRVRNNGSSGGQFHAGVRSDDNALVVAAGSGDVDISNNFGPGIEATNGGALDVSGATINNNTEDGIRLLGNSQVAFFPPNTNAISGNGGRSILCDNSSYFFGDLTGLYNVVCRVAELRGRPHRSWMDNNSPREEKPVPYIPAWRKH